MTSGPHPPGSPGSRGGPFRAFRSRDFTFFWTASLFSIVSFFMLIIARGWLVLEMTNSAFMVTAVGGVAQLPSLALSVLGGVLADRFNRKAILLATEATNLGVLLVMAVLVATGTIRVWEIFVLALINGSSFALAFPARAAIVPNLVAREEIANGVALSSMMFSGGQLVGPALAGYLLASYQMSVSFFVPALALVPTLTLFSLVRLRRGREEAAMRRGSVLTGIREGLGYIRGEAVILGLMVISLVVILFGTPYQVLLPVFARDVLHAGSGGLGLLSAAGGLGAIAGSLLVATRTEQRHLRAFLMFGVLGLGVTVVLFSLSPIFLVSLVFSLLLGFFFSVFMTGGFALLQVLVPDHLRGRVLSARFIVFGFSPLSVFAVGAAAETWGTPLASAATGVLCLLGGAATLLAFPSLRRAPSPAVVEPATTGTYERPAPR